MNAHPNIPASTTIHGACSTFNTVLKDYFFDRHSRIPLGYFLKERLTMVIWFFQQEYVCQLWQFDTWYLTLADVSGHYAPGRSTYWVTYGDLMS